MVRRLNVYVLWNGAWEVVEGRYKYTGDALKAKTFSIMCGITIKSLQEEVVKRMKSDYDGKPIKLHHMRSGADHDRYPAVMIEDEQDLADMFEVYDPTDFVPLFVTSRSENPEELGGQCLQKLDCRRGNNGSSTEEALANSIDNNPVSLEYLQDIVFHDLDTGGMDQPIDGSESSNDRGQEEIHDENLGAEHFGTNGTYPESTMPDIGSENDHIFPNSLEDHPKLEPGVSASNSRADGVEIEKGDVFGSAEELVGMVRKAAMRDGWQFRSKRRDATRVVLICVDPECKWYVGAYKPKEGIYYKLKMYDNTHTCSPISSDFKHRNVTRTVIAREMLDRFVDPPTVGEVLAYSSGPLKSQCSRWKGYSVRQAVFDILQGTREENYRDLPAFFHITTELNPGTVWDIAKDEHNRFKYCYFALGAQIQGISCMRPLVVVDCVSLKREPGLLVFATMVDSEEHCYPIAWGAFESENDASWTWFLQKVQQLLPDNAELTFLSDQNTSIEHAIKTVYPQASHVICIHHLKENLNKMYPMGKWRTLFNEAVYAYTPEECKKFLNQIDKLCKSRNSDNGKTIGEYLLDEVGIERWTRSFSRTSRFDILTSNHDESLNSLLNDARKQNLISLFQMVIERMSEWFYNRREVGHKMGTTLTDKREKIMKTNYDRALKLRASHISSMLFRVQGGPNGEHRVDFENRACTCGRFQTDWQPCVHACACAAELEQTVTTIGDNEMGVMCRFTSELYLVEKFRQAYAGIIVPVPNRNEWDREALPSHIREDNPLPPVKAKRSGRERDARSPSEGERKCVKKKYKCSKCDKTGHNRANCNVVD